MYTKHTFSARIFAVFTILSMLASAFPVAFFVAEAATVGSESQFFLNGGTERNEVVIDTTGFENLTYSFNVVYSDLDSGETFSFGTTDGVTDSQLELETATANDDDNGPVTVSYTNVPLAAPAGVTTFYFEITASDTNDQTRVSDFVIKGDEVVPDKTETEIDVFGDTFDGTNDGWLFNRDTSTASEFEFTSDESSIGDGSIYVEPIDGSINGDKDKFIGELFVFDPLSEFELLTYDVQRGAGADASDANEFYLNVYINYGDTPEAKFYDCKYDIVPSSVSNSGFTTITFDPTQPASSVDTFSGRSWDPIPSPYTCPPTPADMLTQDDSDNGPYIRFFSINLGDTSNNDAGVDGYFDKVVYETTDLITTYDFEPANKKVGPVLECVADLGDGVYEARFGVDNKNAIPVTVPIGNNNKFTGGGTDNFDQGQGTEFAPGRSVNTVQVLFDGSDLVWTLKNPDGGKGGTATASSNSKECPKPKTGDLRVCKLLVDRNGNLSEGAALSGDFSVDITGPEGFSETVTFSPALNLNTDLVSDNGEANDAQCVVFEDVAVGKYEYKTETIVSEYSWETPLYHDFFTKTPDSIDDFAEFTIDGSDNDNDDTDGVINLGKNKSRTLAIVNTQTPVCAIGENLLTNGSFEEPEVTTNKLWDKFAAVAGWVIEKVSDESPTTLELHRGWSGNTAADGWQYTELDGDHSTQISQTFDTEPGATYELKWSFAARHNIAAEQNQLQVLIDGVEVGTNGPATDSAGLTPSDWSKDVITFMATGEETTVTFLDAGPSNSFGTFLDDTAVCFVREPELKATLEITNPPVDDEVLPPAPFSFAAEYFDDDTTIDTINWAIKPGSCEANTPEINLLGFGTAGYAPAPYNPATGEITIDADMTEFDDGDYCLVVNPAETGGETDTERVIRLFTIETPLLTCEIVSDTTTVIEETNELAMATYDGNNNWTAMIPGATWIWDTFLVSDPTNEQTNTFIETFTVDDKDAVDEAILTVAADNGYKVTLNGVEIVDRSDQETNFRAHTVKDFDVAGELLTGENRLEIEVTNFAGSSNPRNNPAGALYKLEITAPTACERTTDTLDDEPPVVTVLAPTDGVVVTTDFNITVNATDDRGIEQLVINLYDTTGAFMAPCLNSNGGGVLDFTDSCTVDVSSLDPGTYSFRTNARDTSTNLSNTESQTFIVPEQLDPTYVVSGFKFEGATTSETTLEDWTIFAASGELLFSTTTDENGFYSFDLPAGDWQITEQLEEGWQQVAVLQNGFEPDGGRCFFSLGELDQQEIESLDSQSAFFSISEENTCDFYNERSTFPEDPDDSDGNGGSSSSGTDPNFRSASIQPLVAGATTSQCPFLVDYMQMGADNDRMEVMKLQLFLNIFSDMFGGTQNPVTGTFGSLTDANVKAFQEHFRSEILDPWFEEGIVPHNRPTGFVYKTTLWKINDIVCGAEFPSLEGETLQTNVDLDVTGVED